MKCNNCGTENKANTNFCENCGKPMQKRTNTSTILSIVGIFYFLCLLMIFYFIKEETIFKVLFVGSYALDMMGGCLIGPALATLPFSIIGIIILLISIISTSKQRKLFSKLDTNAILHIIVIVLFLINFIMFYNYFASVNVYC